MKRMTSRRQFFQTISTLLAARNAPAAKKSTNYIVYIGTYTNQGKSKGIHAFRFDGRTGKLTPVGLAVETVNPSFLTIHQNHKYLYAVGENRGGAVSAFTIDPQSTKLTLINQVSSQGAGPCFVAVDRTGKDVLVANYNSGTLAALPIKADGGLAEASATVKHSGTVFDPKRQGGPHAHSINVSLDNRFAIAADLGLDKLFVYRFDPAAGSLTPNEPPFAKVKDRSGPRHFAFHPTGRFAYVINEISSTVTAFTYDKARGVLTEVQTISTLPQDFTGNNNSTAEVQVHPSGKFLYGSNRGHNSIAVFRIDTRKGTLTPVGHVPTQGNVPRNFGVEPGGSWLIVANQNSDNIVVFRIDGKTGNLTPTGQSLEVGAPVCVKFMAV